MNFRASHMKFFKTPPNDLALLKKQIVTHQMQSTNDLWEILGDVEEDDIPHVLTKLFTIYEEKLERNPDDKAVIDFFKHLSQALDQVNECNLNRR